MKKLFSVLIVVMVLLAYACGKGGDDPKTVMSDMFNVMDQFITGMEKAQNADDVVAVIDGYSASMQKLTPRIKAVEKKYPELKGMKGDNLPAEFKEFEQKFKDLSPKMMGVMGKIMQYASDPKVQAAQQKMMEAMKSLGE